MSTIILQDFLLKIFVYFRFNYLIVYPYFMQNISFVCKHSFIRNFLGQENSKDIHQSRISILTNSNVDSHTQPPRKTTYIMPNFL